MLKINLFYLFPNIYLVASDIHLVGVLYVQVYIFTVDNLADYSLVILASFSSFS